MSRFDIEKLSNSFASSLKDDDDVLMDEYLEAFWEINKFFQLMGSIFSFVSSDVESKIIILQELRTKPNGDQFETFRQMIEYERSNGLLTKSDYVSGCRTLLRLHRGLEFLREFLYELSQISPEDHTHPVCRKAYDCTLAKYHPWLIRTGATMAMYALPTRDQLLKKICIEHDKAISVLPDMLHNAKLVHQRTEQLYTLYDLHNLP